MTWVPEWKEFIIQIRGRGGLVLNYSVSVPGSHWTATYTTGLCVCILLSVPKCPLSAWQPSWSSVPCRPLGVLLTGAQIPGSSTSNGLGDVPTPSQSHRNFLLLSPYRTELPSGQMSGNFSPILLVPDVDRVPLRESSLPRLRSEKEGPVRSLGALNPPWISNCLHHVGQEKSQGPGTQTPSCFLLPFEALWLGNHAKSFILFLCGGK